MLHGKLFVVGGGVLARQTRQGSAPRSLPVVQVLDSKSNTWYAANFTATVSKRQYLFLASAWVDHKRKQLYSLHSGNSLVVADLVPVDSFQDEVRAKHSLAATETFKQAFVRETRGLAISSFQSCMDMELTENNNRDGFSMKSRFEEGYDQVRGTWNRRHRHLQYPDIVTFPNLASHVASIVRCATRTGYHVCGRNGKHAFDGATCTNGIVVDVSGFDEIQVVDQANGIVRLGAGLTLGRIDVELEPYGLAWEIVRV